MKNNQCGELHKKLVEGSENQHTKGCSCESCCKKCLAFSFHEGSRIFSALIFAVVISLYFVMVFKTIWEHVFPDYVAGCETPDAWNLTVSNATTNVVNSTTSVVEPAVTQELHQDGPLIFFTSAFILNIPFAAWIFKTKSDLFRKIYMSAVRLCGAGLTGFGFFGLNAYFISVAGGTYVNPEVSVTAALYTCSTAFMAISGFNIWGEKKSKALVKKEFLSTKAKSGLALLRFMVWAQRVLINGIGAGANMATSFKYFASASCGLYLLNDDVCLANMNYAYLAGFVGWAHGLVNNLLHIPFGNLPSWAEKNPRLAHTLDLIPNVQIALALVLVELVDCICKILPADTPPWAQSLSFAPPFVFVALLDVAFFVNVFRVFREERDNKKNNGANSGAPLGIIGTRSDSWQRGRSRSTLELTDIREHPGRRRANTTGGI